MNPQNENAVPTANPRRPRTEKAIPMNALPTSAFRFPPRPLFRNLFAYSLLGAATRSVKLCIFICVALHSSLVVCFAQTPASPHPSTPSARLGLYFDSVAGEPRDQWFSIGYAGRRMPGELVKIGGTITHTQYTVIAYSPQPQPATLLIEHNATRARFQLELRKLTWVDP